MRGLTWARCGQRGQDWPHPAVLRHETIDARGELVVETLPSLSSAEEHGLDVDHWSSVDGLNGSDLESVSGDLRHPNAMEPERVWTIGRARCEYAGERKALVRARVNLEHVAAGSVKP